MSIVFFGSDNFAVPALKALVGAGYKIPCVVTQPDKAKGRGLSLSFTPVKITAKELALKIYQPDSLNSPDAERFLRNLSPDLFVVVAYGKILPQSILDIPRIFSVNAHASLLPKYRGASPINRAIINGDKLSGVTIIKMSAKMDAGPIILQVSVEIGDNDTAISLEEKLARIAAQVLIDSLKLIENKAFNLTAQDENKVSFAPKLKKEYGLINWNLAAQKVRNRIKGCAGWPGAFTYYKGKLLKIYEVDITQPSASNRRSQPGEIIEVSKEDLVVACGQDALSVRELQLEGKRRMEIREFIAGHKISVGEKLGN